MKILTVLLLLGLISTIVVKADIYISLIIGLALVFSLLFLLINSNEVKNNKSLESKENIIKSLQREIDEIEKEIFNYTRLVKSSSYEDFIRKLKSYEEFALFEGKEKIKISEKSNQISLYNIEELKETYNKNQNNFNKVLDLSKTNDINEVIYKISKYEEINKELLSLKIEIEKEENL